MSLASNIPTSANGLRSRGATNRTGSRTVASKTKVAGAVGFVPLKAQLCGASEQLMSPRGTLLGV